ncbi:hypothetical protein [Agathobacter sp.]
MAEIDNTHIEEKTDSKSAYNKETEAGKVQNDEQFRQMYEKLMSYENTIHEQNQRRIKIGMRCIYIIPLIFLVLLLVTESSKIVFLVLWIVSLFGIAVYLIGVEYVDYKLQEKMNEISGRGDTVESLISVEQMAGKVSDLVEKIEETKEEVKL